LQGHDHPAGILDKLKPLAEPRPPARAGRIIAVPLYISSLSARPPGISHAGADTGSIGATTPSAASMTSPASDTFTPRDQGRAVLETLMMRAATQGA
jgi:hypothetical protein